MGALWGIAAALMAIAFSAIPTMTQSAQPRPRCGAPAMSRYRALTKHSPTRARRHGHRIDWRNKPALYRDYLGAETVALPPPKRLGRSALEAIAQTHPAAAATAPQLDLELLGTVLFLAGGISGTRPSSGGDVRTTAAAGALYPNEIYAVTGPLPGLTAGVYHYNPKRERLSRLRDGDWRPILARAAVDEGLRTAPATIIVTGILWRSAWKYRERAYRHLYWDGGMMVAHILAAAAAAELPATVIASFVDADVDRLVGGDGRREKTLALLPLGAPQLAAVPPRVATQQVPPLTLASSSLSPRPIDYPEALRYHTASMVDDTETVSQLRSARLRQERLAQCVQPLIQLPAPAAPRGDPSLDAVIRRRRSARHFAHRPLSAADLAAIVQLPTRGASADFLTVQPTLLETYVIVNAVDGMAPGAYHYNRPAHALAELARGNFRNMSGFLCLEQALARDASAVLYYLADLDAVGHTYGERGYRFAELEAGLVAGRAYLAAYAIGRGATGLTFYDDEVAEFFSPHAAGLEPLLVVAVGIPQRRR